MTRIVICGIRGRMGRTLARLARERADIDVIGGIATDTDDTFDIPVVTLDAASALIADAHVLIDFSSATATRDLLDHTAGSIAGRALVTGTTGLDADTYRRLEELASRAAILTAANFSLGVNLLLGLTERVATTLDAASCDIEVVETHHRRKTDAPSGTALALGAAAAKGRNVNLDDVRVDGRSGQTGVRAHGQIGFHAVRGGGVIGEHRVVFACEREVLELRHEALDRAVFAEGALTAARWIAGRPPGRFTMQDVLGL